MAIVRAIAAAVFLLTAAGTLEAQAPAKVTEFEVNGIRVIACPAANELVSVVVGLEGGLASGETNNPALADFTADLVTSSGSASFNKEALRRFLSQTSTQLSGAGDYRGVSYTMTATRPNFDRAWAMLASIVSAPALDEVEFRNIMQRRTTDVKRRWASPEGYAGFMADSMVKLGHPVLGRTIQQPDVESVSIAAIRDYLNKIGERSRMLVVIVGNVSQNDIRKKLAAFASVPAGSYRRPPIAPLTPSTAPKVEIVDRNTPTTYVQSSFAGPRAGDPDYWSLQVGLLHLRNILFQELRTKRNLTYAPGASLQASLGQSRGVLSVSSTMPDSSITIMYHELDRMKRGEIDEGDLNDSRQVFITAYYTRQMTNDGMANAIYGAQRNAGDWRFAFSLDAINAITKASVQAAFAKYAHRMQVAIVGKKSLVTESRYLYSD